MNIVKEMEKMKFDKDLIVQCIESNKHNNISTTLNNYFFLSLKINIFLDIICCLDNSWKTEENQ